MVSRVFIYGHFGIGGGAFDNVRFTKPPSALAPQAIEILREPSVLELIGKVYVLTSSRNYQPVTPFGVSSFSWFTEYQQASKRSEAFYFNAEQGDRWQVKWMRQESDEAGPYIAVGLKHD
jgi:hypothetical protein